jgi:hypothetical protein
LSPVVLSFQGFPIATPDGRSNIIDIFQVHSQ